VARWFTKTAALIAFMACGSLLADDSKPLPSPLTLASPVSFSASKQKKRAAWQEHLTLGPGDSVDIAVAGYPETVRTNIFVGPDGRFSYLQLQDYPVSGLTIDELRSRLDQELSKYYKPVAKTIVTPVAFKSKKYYVLGKVAVKGVFTLDRPLTVVEAVARAKGLETGLYDRNTVELADLSRAVLIRKGARVPVNFEKLFLQGDLSQNVQIEPGDYLYFPGTSANEIFVIGEVMNPGPLGFTPSATLIAALTDRGGFSERAYKKRVLVIRGSLNQPETFAVDAAAILTARAPDFKLEPKDIVYVSSRPWIKIEELLDDATQSFIQAAVTTWAGAYIGPIITQPIIPHP
jgi:protein involved in polysaccharide export with SLBB domain